MTLPRTAFPLRFAWRDKWLFAAGFALLCQARVILSLRGFGAPQAGCRPIHHGPPAPPALARRVALSIESSKRFVPRATCLVQAMAGRKLLALKGHTSSIRVGVRSSQTAAFEAHAWLVSGDLVVLGGSETELAGFAPIVGKS